MPMSYNVLFIIPFVYLLDIIHPINPTMRNFSYLAKLPISPNAPRTLRIIPSYIIQVG
jgi:hypothetical protein